MLANNRPLRVFLCHAVKDWQAANDLFLQLKRVNWLEVWFVGADLDFDQNWEAEIRSAVDRADVVIALISWRSYNTESYFYPDPNFVFDILESQPREYLLLLPLILGRFGVPKDMIANGMDYSRKNSRSSVERQILADLKQRAMELGLSTADSIHGSASEAGIQWSPTRWKELKNMLDDSAANATFESSPLQKPAKPKLRSTAWLFAALVLVAMVASSLIGRFMSSVNDGENNSLVSAPIVGKALTILASPTSVAEKKPALPPTFVPGAGDAQFSTVDGAPMVYVPAGKFTMGSNYKEREQPVHVVNLSAFWMDKFEVTNEQYVKCAHAGACSPPVSKKFYDDPAFKDHPVVFVDWEAAKNYCAWAGRRLPTEAEWEKAARGIDKQTYPWESSLSCDKANYGKNCIGGTTPVGSYPMWHSPYGVLDMAGNVWEWVADWYDELFYFSRSANVDPVGPLSGEHKVLRGGSWISTKTYLRATDRWRNLPGYNSDYIGFRCAMPADD